MSIFAGRGESSGPSCSMNLEKGDSGPKKESLTSSGVTPWLSTRCTQAVWVSKSGSMNVERVLSHKGRDERPRASSILSIWSGSLFVFCFRDGLHFFVFIMKGSKGETLKRTYGETTNLRVSIEIHARKQNSDHRLAVPPLGPSFCEEF